MLFIEMGSAPCNLCLSGWCHIKNTDTEQVNNIGAALRSTVCYCGMKERRLKPKKAVTSTVYSKKSQKVKPLESRMPNKGLGIKRTRCDSKLTVSNSAFAYHYKLQDIFLLKLVCSYIYFVFILFLYFIYSALQQYPLFKCMHPATNNSRHCIHSWH